MTGIGAAVRRPLAIAAAGYLAVLVLAALLAPVLAPYPPGATDLDSVLSGPAAAHPLGTDGIGRDVLSRLMYGGRESLPHAAVAALTVMLVGAGSGIVAGFLGGWVDRVFTWVVDIMLAIPVIVTLLAILAMVDGNQLAAMVGLGVLMAPGLARVTRSSALAVRQELYIAAARVSGLSNRHILVKHVLPRVAGPIVVQLSLITGGALLIDAGLSYLGFGPPPPAATWGTMIADAAAVIDRQPWLLVPPGVTLGLAILACGLLGDAMRDATAARTGQQPARRTRSRPRPEPSRVDDRVLLSIVDLSVAIGGTPVLDDVSLHIGAGETVGLVGESGCGKSITCRAILGLPPPGGTVTGGGIRLAGTELTDSELRRMRGSRIALVSQNPMTSLDPVHTVGRQLGELIRRHHGGSRQAVRARTHDLLTSVGLEQHTARQYPHQISGGMAQRVGIAMALAGEPDLLIADEPTTALDAALRTEVLDLLRAAQTARNMAILLISHDWGVVASMCQRAYVMYAGQILESGNTADLLQRPRHPYTAGLLACLPRPDRRHQHLAVISGSVPEPGAWPAGCRFAPRCSLATAGCLNQPIPLLPSASDHHTRCILEVGQHDRATAAHP